jgi:hypothetical protein
LLVTVIGYIVEAETEVIKVKVAAAVGERERGNSSRRAR